MTTMLLPHITNKQQKVNPLLYRFRFLNRIQIQTLLNNPDLKNINTWLKDLFDKQYIGRIVNSNSKVNVVPTIYYTELNGIRYLKTRKEFEKAYIARLYKEKKKSKQFVDRCIFIAEVYIQFFKKYATSDFSFYTQSDFKLNAVIRDLLPDFVFKKKNDSKFTICELFKEKMPRYAIRSRIENYLTFSTEGEWTINEKPPFIVFVCPSETVKKYVQKYTKYQIEEMGIETLDFKAVSFQEIQGLDFEEVKNKEG